MPTVKVKTLAGKAAGAIDLDESVFGIEPNVAVMHQVVTAQLAARRAGTQSTKGRSEVRGGGAKPWKQKGTGRARAGSSSSPIWIGGGIAHGPKPRKYNQRTNKKMVKLALSSALSDRVNEDKLVVVDDLSFDTPSTKEAVKIIEALELDGRILVVIDDLDSNEAKSFRNLQNAQLLTVDQLNAYDVLVNDYLLITQSSLLGSDSEIEDE